MVAAPARRLRARRQARPLAANLPNIAANTVANISPIFSPERKARPTLAEYAGI
jgi:hypothetical protein